MKLKAYDVILSPVITEKSTLVSEANQVIFKVAPKAAQTRWSADPFPSTYKPYPSSPTVIRGATIYTLSEVASSRHGRPPPRSSRGAATRAPVAAARPAISASPASPAPARQA